MNSESTRRDLLVLVPKLCLGTPIPEAPLRLVTPTTQPARVAGGKLVPIGRGSAETWARPRQARQGPATLSSGASWQ